MTADHHLHRWGLRLRSIEGLVWGAWGLAVGLTLGLVLAMVARIVPLLMSRTLAELAALLALVGACGGMAAAWLRPRSPYRLARAFDRRLALAERLTTALEIRAGRVETTAAMADAQLADTLAAARRVDIRAALPRRIPRRAALASLLLTTALAFSLGLPNPQEETLLHQAAVRAAVENQVERLEAAREEIGRTRALSDEEQEALLRALEEVLAALQEGPNKPQQVVAALAEAERALAPLQDPGAAAVEAGLERAARELVDSELTREIAELLAQGDYSAAAESLAAYAGTQGEPLTGQQQLELARELAQAAEAVAEIAPQLEEQLAKATAAIERGDIAQAREAIRKAAEQLAEEGERIQRQQAVEGTLAALQEGRERIAQAGGRADSQGDNWGAQVARGEQQGNGQGAGAGQQLQPGHHEDAGSAGPYDEVYAPQRMSGEGPGINLGRDGEEGSPSGEAPLPAPERGGASIPYREVYADYAAQAHAALEGSYIPLGMKQYVRDYFSSLEP